MTSWSPRGCDRWTERWRTVGTVLSNNLVTSRMAAGTSFTALVAKLGCRVSWPSISIGPRVGAIVVDVWRVQPWIEGRWGARVDVDAIKKVIATLMHGGELVVGDWPSQVAVANDV